MTEEPQNMAPYQRIARSLRDQIVGGVIAPGERIPSTRELVDREGVAKATIDKAMRVLREDGLVEPVAGVGLMVKHHSRVDAPKDMFLRTQGVTPKMRLPNERSEFRHAGYDQASERVATALGVPKFSPVVIRSRLIRRSETPTYIATSWFRAELGELAPKLLVNEPIPEGTANYVQAATGSKLTKGRDIVSIDRLDVKLGWELAVGRDEPVLFVQSCWYDSDGDVVEFGAYHIVEGRELSYEYELTNE